MRVYGIKIRVCVIENYWILEMEDIDKMDEDVFKIIYSFILEFEILMGEKYIVIDFDNMKLSKYKIGKEY